MLKIKRLMVTGLSKGRVLPLNDVEERYKWCNGKKQ